MPELGLAGPWAAAGVAALASYLALFGFRYALSRRYASTHREGERQEAPITVLQPILSGDPSLGEMLARNLTTSPPWARFLWLIDEDDGEAAAVTEALVAGSEGRASVLACPPAEDGINPKTAKLQRALDVVRTPYVAVLDDDTTIGTDALPRAIAALERCTLYTGLPSYLPGEDVWSSLTAHFVNNNSVLTYLPVAALVGPLTINGMFYVMRTRSLADLGGFAPILHSACDDYALARLVTSRGGLIRQGVEPLRLRTTVGGPGRYVRLMHRWMVFANVLAFEQPLRVGALLFVLLALPPWLLWLALVSMVRVPALIPWVAGVLVVRHAGLRHLHRVVLGGVPGFSATISVLAELLQPLHWLHACLRTTIRWRTRHIRVARDGTFRSLSGGRS